MKTKVNEVQLVGPRGRKELLSKINELEKKVAELEANPPAPQKTVVQIVDTVEDGTEEEARNALRINGEIPTLEQLRALDISNTIFEVSGSFYLPTLYVIPENGFYADGGFASATYEDSFSISIDHSENTGKVTTMSM